MGRVSTTWEKGQSGNPKGRPPKNRALTAILERTGNVKREVKGKPVSAKRLLAQLLWEAATTGRVTFPDETDAKQLDQQEWIGVVKFVYQHIDGPPKAEVDITSDGEKVEGITYIKEVRPNDSPTE